MFDEKTLKDLAAIEANGPILSVYLDVDPTQRSAEEYKLILREMLKKINGDVDADDIDTVKQHVDLAYDGSGRGLAMFSRQAEDIWYAFTLPVSMHSDVIVAPKPHISPLVEFGSRYGSFAVALIDRQGARFFYYQMGEIVKQEGTVGEDIRHTRKGRGSSVVGMRGGAPSSGRKEAEIVQRNLRDAAAALAEFCRQHAPRQLLLAGTEHTVAQFQEHLPTPLQNIVVGTFVADMEDSEATIREHAFNILKALGEERQQQQAEAIITAAAKGQNGVLGLDQILSVAHEGRVQLLMVTRHYHEPGYRCTGCGYLTTQPLDTCVFCQGTFEEIPDAVAGVVSQVVEKGGKVEVVDDDTLDEAQIGALLRY